MKKVISVFILTAMHLAGCERQDVATLREPASDVVRKTDTSAEVQDNFYNLTMQELKDKPIKERKAILQILTREEEQSVINAYFDVVGDESKMQRFMQMKLKDVLKEQREITNGK